MAAFVAWFPMVVINCKTADLWVASDDWRTLLSTFSEIGRVIPKLGIRRKPNLW